jgi:CobQ/CobB/MinD/ParA family nucleotide binding protein
VSQVTCFTVTLVHRSYGDLMTGFTVFLTVLQTVFPFLFFPAYRTIRYAVSPALRIFDGRIRCVSYILCSGLSYLRITGLALCLRFRYCFVFVITIAVVNRKGGPGKTTVAILAAIGLHENGARVGAIDADHEQGSLTNSLFGSAIEVNPSNLESLDFLVIDTPPNFNDKWDRAVKLADIIILVTTPSPPELVETETTYARIIDLGCAEKTVVLFNKFRANTRSGRKDLDERTKQVTGSCNRFDFVVPFREFFSALHAVPWPGNGEKIPLLKLLNRVLGRDGRDAYYAAIQLAGGITQHYLRMHGKQGKNRG